MKYCTYCGKAMEDQNLYCPYCGKKVPDLNKRVEAQPLQTLNGTSPLQDNVYLEKAEGYVKKWAKPAILSIAAMIYGAVMTIYVIILLGSASSVSESSSISGIKSILQIFPAIYWLSILAGIVLLALAIYRYVHVKEEKVNIIYAVIYGIEVLLVHHLKDLKELANSINNESVGGFFSYGFSVYNRLSDYKTTFIFLALVGLALCFVGYAVRRQMQNKPKISQYFDVYQD